jgi:two-component system sensor histidine kinase VicK
MKKNSPLKKTSSFQSKIADPISIVAHQLKSPLSVIKGYLEALLSGDCGKINSLQREYLSDALENVQRMKRNIEDLLFIQKIEENKLKILRQPFSLEKLTFKIIKDFLLWAKASNCEILFEKPKDLPKAFGDPQLIQGVIENLISNAIKYTQGRGKVEINIFQKKKEKKLIFMCKDNGIGIPKEDFKKVFTKFYRSQKAIELDPSGTGLGLYINKAIIEQCGGKIWFKRNKGQGVTFYFSLPIAKI